MTIELSSLDERTVEQATSLLRMNGFRVIGRVINGRNVLIGVPK